MVGHSAIRTPTPSWPCRSAWPRSRSSAPSRRAVGRSATGRCVGGAAPIVRLGRRRAPSLAWVPHEAQRCPAARCGRPGHRRRAPVHPPARGGRDATAVGAASTRRRSCSSLRRALAGAVGGPSSTCVPRSAPAALASRPRQSAPLPRLRRDGWRLALLPVELWFRPRPGCCSGAVGAAVLGVCARCAAGRRPRRVRCGRSRCRPVVVYAGVIAVSEKQYARYLLPLLPLVASPGGDGGGAGRTAATSSPPAIAAVGGQRLAVGALFTASLAPYAIAFVDPLVGGQARAERTHPARLGGGGVLASPRRPGGAPLVGRRGVALACPDRQDFSWLDGTARRRSSSSCTSPATARAEPPGLRPYLPSTASSSRRRTSAVSTTPSSGSSNRADPLDW